MRPVDERADVIRLAAAGLNASQIAATTGIPRSTVREWLVVPRRRPPKRPSCARCGHPPHAFEAIPDSEYALLLGFYLGDGTISIAPKGVYRLRVSNDLRYPAVTAECAVAAACVMPTSRVGFARQVGCVDVSSYSKAWPCVLPYYGPGPKHRRRIVLTEWQVEKVARRPHQFIRGLLLSDGCRITNVATTKHGRGRYEYPRYFFTNASADIRELFCSALTALGVRYTRPTERDVSIARRRSVEYLDRFVGPKA